MKTKSNILRFLSLSISILIIQGIAFSQEFNYLPATVEGNQIITYTQFSLSYNEANWVAYELTKEEVEMTEDRCDCFRMDRQVTTKSAVSSDYKNTGFDLGHLSPAADNNMSPKANKESFKMSNISPQLPSFNRGIWKSLEDSVRKMAIANQTVYVVTGPVFINNLGSIGKNEVTIPGYYFKVLLKREGESIKTIAFLLPHVGAVGEISDYIVTVNSVETLTGIDFFPELKKSIENRVESQYEPNNWGF